MATLREAIDYSKKNPQSDFAKQLKLRIQSGQADQDFVKEGLDATAYGRPAVEVQEEEVEEPGYLERVVSSTREDVDRRTENVMRGQQAEQRGEQTGLETATQTFGQGLGLAWDVGFNLLSEATPKAVKDALKGAAETPIGQAGIKAVSEGMESYEGWKAESPENARVGRDIEAALNIGLSVPGGAAVTGGTKLASKGVVKGSELALEKGSEALMKGTQAADRAISKGVSRATEMINPTPSEAIVQKYFEKAVRPTITNKGSASQVAKYRENTSSAIDLIRKNKSNLKYADDGADDVAEAVTGQTPKTLQQLSEAVEQTKKTIFKQYDDLAKTAGKQGVKVDMKPIADELDVVLNDRAIQLTNPQALQYAKQVKERFEEAGKLNATVAQDVIAQYNKSLEAFYRNPSYDNASKAAIDALVANKIRQALDEGISGLTGSEYQALKSQYGSLKTIEKDVVKAALRDARKNTKGLIDYTDIFSGGQVLSGLLTLNPALMASGGAQYGIKEFIKHINSPNRSVQKMFDTSQKIADPKAPGGGPKALVEKTKQYFKDNPPSMGLAIKDVSKEGFKNFEDLSTKLLGKLEGRTTVSRQFIEDLTNSADLKQPERDLFRSLLKEEGNTINVPDFANKVKSELLPLEVGKPVSNRVGGASGMTTSRYENITLPDELRGPVASYGERVYNSPIKTSAGDVHFSGMPGNENYFAHTRIEDLPGGSYKEGLQKSVLRPGDSVAKQSTYKPGDTRRVIEIQSDLFQKGRLEDETKVGFYNNFEEGNINPEIAKLIPESEELIRLDKQIHIEGKRNLPTETVARWDELSKKAFEAAKSKRLPEVAKLEPYRNTWHERLIREEVKQAAKDGKTKLQFPTGETAMKIEGLGDTTANRWFDVENQALKPEKLKTGDTIYQISVNNSPQDGWIITDVLGDGKFKAVPKSATEKPNFKDDMDLYEETFDISGKVDKENPIYKFYEKEVARYLKNKYGAKPVTDPQGVQWMEVEVKPEMAKTPVEAYGVMGATIPQEEED